MSSENEDQLSLGPPVGNSTPESDPKKPIIRYARDFFLSLSGLDVCKKLPSGLDKSILSGLDEAANATFERQKSVGISYLQGSRRGEYVAQSLNRSENSNAYTRGSSSRWDTRSSGLSDKEGDLQCDRETFTQDSGRRFVNQNRRTWQHSEHDGLLGSGALAKSSGYAGASIPKDKGNGQNQLSKSTEPYQPPRPYKAVPYSRKDGTDSCNDETFGSSECSNQDRAEEERKRRESFELMRKDQKKSLQEKLNKDSHKGILDVDIMALLDKSDADKNTKSRCKPDEPSADSFSRGDTSKSSSHILVPAARPLVPPGFASTLMEKNQQINKLKSTTLQSADEKENPSAPSSVIVDVGFGNISLNKSGLQEVNEVREEDITNKSFHKKERVPDCADVVNQDHSTSIFDKLFENSVVKNSDSLASDLQNNVNDADEEAWTHLTSASSKFAHLFHEESEVVSSPVTGMPLESYKSDEQSSSCAVLTCEDLEQSILAEVKGRSSVMQSLREPWTAFDSKSEEYKDSVDNHASQHLLSLLQRGTNLKEALDYNSLDVSGSHEMRATSDVESSLFLQVTDNAGISVSESGHISEKQATLEALFGAAFMNELHSMEAPVSAQKTLVGNIHDSNSSGNSFPFHLSDILSSTSDDQHTKNAIFDREMFELNNAPEHKRSHKNAGNWTGDIYLPEEDSLISLNNSLDAVVASENTVGDLGDNLLHAILRAGECSREHAVVVDHDGQYRHRHHHHHHQMNHGRPFFVSHLDHHPTFGKSHLDHHHAFANHNPSYHSISGPPSARHPALQPMQIPGNFPSYNPIHGLPGSHPINHLQAFPLHQRLSSHGGHAMGMPGSVRGAVEGEALERLMEMERRANPKQFHPSMPDHVPGMFDMNLRYR